MKWRIEGRGRFYDPGESTVVYYSADSGDTHLLSDLAAFIIRQFDERPLTVEDLAERVTPAMDPGQFSDLEKALRDILEELTALEILKQI